MSECPDQVINKKHELLYPCGHKNKELLEHPDPISEPPDGQNSQQTQMNIQTNNTAVQISETPVIGPQLNVNMDSEASINNTLEETEIHGQNNEDNTFFYQSALIIFDEEQLRNQDVIYTRRMKRKRIEEIISDWIDPG